jgi:hypothetical protein
LSCSKRLIQATIALYNCPTSSGSPSYTYKFNSESESKGYLVATVPPVLLPTVRVALLYWLTIRTCTDGLMSPFQFQLHNAPQPASHSILKLRGPMTLMLSSSNDLSIPADHLLHMVATDCGPSTAMIAVTHSYKNKIIKPQNSRRSSSNELFNKPSSVCFQAKSIEMKFLALAAAMVLSSSALAAPVTSSSKTVTPASSS